MEPSESREPSYYEVALTNRQVLVAFVVLLSCVLAAFLSGVWIGRGAAERTPPPAIAAQAQAADPQLEQLTFFTGKEPGARTAAAAPRPAATAAPAPPAAATPGPAAGRREDETGGEAMRRTLDAEVAAARATATPRPTATPAPQPAAAAAKPAAAAGKLFVQVYSSTNSTRAKEIVAQLRGAGFKVQLADIAKTGGQTQHRVRVGPYESRAAADAAATRLRREFRLDTWVTDTP